MFELMKYGKFCPKTKIQETNETKYLNYEI